jgi:biopolymer transport protein ExbD
MLPEPSLVLAAMVDMLVNILIFLLNFFGTDPISIVPTDDLALAASSATEKMEFAVSVVLTRREIQVDGTTVLQLGEADGRPTVPAHDGQLIAPLAAVLTDKAHTARAAADAEGVAFTGEVLLQCDKRVPFSVVREVMYTASQAGFLDFRMVVVSTGEP